MVGVIQTLFGTTSKDGVVEVRAPRNTIQTDGERTPAAQSEVSSNRVMARSERCVKPILVMKQPGG